MQPQCLTGLYTTFILWGIKKCDDWPILLNIVAKISDFCENTHEIAWKIQAFFGK